MDTEYFEFTAHNIRFANGSFTKPDMGYSMNASGSFVSARRLLYAVFPADNNHRRLADLACLEGVFDIEFARMGFQVLGVEVADANGAAYILGLTPTIDPLLEDSMAGSITRASTARRAQQEGQRPGRRCKAP